MKLEICDFTRDAICVALAIIAVTACIIIPTVRYWNFQDKALEAGYTQKAIEGHDGVEWVKP
jgi:hypothetical protein